jgi:hypothetical protein
MKRFQQVVGMRTLFCLVWCLAVPAAAVEPAAEKPFAIRVVDDQTGRGVPLVALKTVNDIVYLTDSNGLVAFDEPGLMHGRVFFSVSSHGYEFPADGFGYHGKSLSVTPGGQATLAIHRLNIAQRLYRVTGAGIYRDSLLLGQSAPLAEPLLNARVLGSDSVVNAIYRGKIYWFWGDTNLPQYPLGIFCSPGAISELPAAGGLDPRQGVNLQYFTDGQGCAVGAAPIRGDGPTWLQGLATLADEKGEERLVCSFVKVRQNMETYRRGLALFDDHTRQFRELAEIELKAPIFPSGHPLRATAAGVEYLYFATPFPLLRVKATYRDWQDLHRYEAFTCLKPGSPADAPQLDRDAAGKLHYAWRTDAPPWTRELQAKLQAAGKLKPGEGWLQLCDPQTGKAITAGYGSVYWNTYRQRWIMIFTQSWGTSMLGETWYAEADAPEGPWVYAVKIVTHQDYSFYNPKQHPMFDADGGRTIFFEGTYTRTFSGTKTGTPRYDYNQLLYQLDLGDPRLALPVPIYRQAEGFSHRGAGGSPQAAGRIAFFALDRPAGAAVAVYRAAAESLAVGAVPAGDKNAPLFYALPADAKDPPPTTLPLYEQVTADGHHRYSVEIPPAVAPAAHSPHVLCRVWRNPLAVEVGSPQNERP